MYFLNDFEMVPVVPLITGITFVFTFHMRCISIVRFYILEFSRLLFLITFLSPETATSINIHVLFSLSRIIMSVLLLGMLCQFIIITKSFFFSMQCLFHLHYDVLTVLSRG
jgi:hypothetical protein